MTTATVISKCGASIYPIVVPTGHHLGTYNFFLYEKQGSLSLIDAGADTDACWEQLIQTLAQNGFSLQDLDRVILTHHHGDHVGLVNRITKGQEVPVYAHVEAIPRLKMERAYLSDRLQFFDQLYKEMGCGSASKSHMAKLKASLENGGERALKADILTIGHGDWIAGLQAVEAPGHSPNQLTFLDRERKWLFGGDLLLRHISSNAIIEPDQQFNRLPTLVQHVESLKKSAALDVDIVLPGHEQFIYDHQELIEQRLKSTEEKAAKILELIRTGVSTAHHLASVYYKRKYDTQFALVISEIIGQLDYLEVHHKVDKKLQDGIWHYEAV